MHDVYQILIVDDVGENIKTAISILKQDGYNFSYALNAEKAMQILKTRQFDLILLDVMMPGMDGFQLCKIIKSSPIIQETPVIFLTAKVDIASVTKGFELGAIDYVTKPFHALELKLRVSTHLELYKYQKKLKSDNKKLSKTVDIINDKYLSEVEIAQKEIIYILTEIMEKDSGETACHVKRVANIAKQLAILEGNLSEEEIKEIYLAAPLHDIGKILIDNKILHKPGKLTEHEYEIMKKHPALGKSILEKSDKKLIRAALNIAYQHHENYDGSGYPQGLVAENIHIYGRIVAIADVLDALTYKRVYKESWTFDNAAEYIKNASGKKFDPRLVTVFLEHRELFKDILEEKKC
jgi:putative two-component system response regulator